MSVWGPLAAFCSSLTWVVGSSAYTHLSRKYVPGVINFNRALIALPLFLLVVAIDRHSALSALTTLDAAGLGARASWLALSMTASYVVGDSLFLYASLSLGFSAAQAIAAVYPLWATLAAILHHDEPLSLGRALGLCTAVLGVVMVVISTGDKDHTLPPERLSFLRSKKLGVALALLASIAWGVNSFSVSRGAQDVHFALGNAFRMSIALVLCPIVAHFQTGERTGVWLERQDYRRFLPLIAFEAFLGSATYLYGLSHSDVAIGATLTSLAPVLSVPLAVALKWEKFSLRKTLGVCVVVLGVTLLLLQ
jgi:drug/metabolite transporter (DMT)-like permease